MSITLTNLWHLNFVEIRFRNSNFGIDKPRSWFGPNGQYIRELPCPSCRGRGYTPCSDCGIERSRPDCSECSGKVCASSAWSNNSLSIENVTRVLVLIQFMMLEHFFIIKLLSDIVFLLTILMGLNELADPNHPQVVVSLLFFWVWTYWLKEPRNLSSWVTHNSWNFNVMQQGIMTCRQCLGDCVIWEESIDERPWEKARSM